MLKPRSGPPLAEGRFAGCIFGDMLFQLSTPQGLKCSATAVQGNHPGKVRMLAQQITKINLTGRYPRIFYHFLSTWAINSISSVFPPLVTCCQKFQVTNCDYEYAAVPYPENAGG